MPKENCKRVETRDPSGNPNGFLVELTKSGRKTTAYLTAAYPGCFKGYHAHRVRESNYVCVKGRVRVVLITKDGREDHILDSSKPERLHIPLNVPTAIINEWDEEGWLINFPEPGYDPLTTHFEQVDLPNIETAMVWVKENG